MVSNLHHQLQNRLMNTLNFAKPDREPPRAVWEAGFAYVDRQRGKLMMWRAGLIGLMVGPTCQAPSPT